METSRSQKSIVVKKIKTLIDQHPSLVVAKYHGLTVKKIQSLRQILKESQIEAKVYKNRLFKVALNESPYKELASFLIGPNLFVYSFESNSHLPAKILGDFAKENQFLKLSAGLYEKKVVNQKEINLIATLPSMEEARTIFAFSLLKPLLYLAMILNKLSQKEKQEGEKDDKIN